MVFVLLARNQNGQFGGTTVLPFRHEAAHEFKCAEVYVAPELKPEFEVKSWNNDIDIGCFMWYFRETLRISKNHWNLIYNTLRLSGFFCDPIT